MASLIAAALARAQGFLLEPPVAAEAPPPAPVPLEACAPVHVVVTGLSRGSGATTIAAGLAHALIVPGVRPSHFVVFGHERGGGPRPPGVVRWELPLALRDAAEIADYGATLARLAAGAGQAAVVWDVPADDVQRAARVMEACDTIVCVAEGAAEPALCALVCDMLAERHGRVLLVANRVREPEDWAGRCAVTVADSRLAALLIARGRTPGARVGEALARLASLVEES